MKENNIVLMLSDPYDSWIIISALLTLLSQNGVQYFMGQWIKVIDNYLYIKVFHHGNKRQIY